MSTTVRAGKLRHRLQFQVQDSTGRDAYGQSQLNWIVAANVWGNVEPITGREAWYAQQVESTTTHRVTIRYSSTSAAFTTAYRILWRGRLLEIESMPDVEGRRVKFEIMCHEHND